MLFSKQRGTELSLMDKTIVANIKTLVRMQLDRMINTRNPTEVLNILKSLTDTEVKIEPQRYREYKQQANSPQLNFVLKAFVDPHSISDRIDNRNESFVHAAIISEINEAKLKLRIMLGIPDDEKKSSPNQPDDEKSTRQFKNS